jgi:DNA adenine methylase
MIKSPLRYPGGKSRAAELIASLIPPFEEYREPFLGGGSVFVHLRQKYPNKQYWVNDIYTELYLFWLNCQENTEGVIKQVEFWKNKYDNGKELYRYLVDNISSFNDLEKAAAFYVFNRITFSGTTEAGGYSEQAFQGRFTVSSIDRLVSFSSVLNNIKVTNLDFKEVVEKEGDNVFLFLDPPYHSATKSALYGKNGKLHKGFNHERFAETMKNCPHKWLLTYDDSDYIRDLFSFAHIHSWNMMYGMRNINVDSNQTGKELFISNYLDELPQMTQTSLPLAKLKISK